MDVESGTENSNTEYFEEVASKSVEPVNCIDDLQLTLVKTTRGRPKLCHEGYYYTTEKSRENKTTWKCERTCNQLNIDKQAAIAMVMPNNIRQRILRKRTKKVDNNI